MGTAQPLLALTPLAQPQRLALTTVLPRLPDAAKRAVMAQRSQITPIPLGAKHVMTAQPLLALTSFAPPTRFVVTALPRLPDVVLRAMMAQPLTIWPTA